MPHLSPYFSLLFPRFNVWKAANPLPSSELSPRIKNRGGGRQCPKDRGAVVEGWTIAGQYFAVKIIHRPGEGGRSGGPRDTNLTDRLLRPTPQFPSADMSIILPRKVVLWPWRMEQGLMRAWAWKGGTVRFLNWTRIMAKVLQVNFLLDSCFRIRRAILTNLSQYLESLMERQWEFFVYIIIVVWESVHFVSLKA